MFGTAAALPVFAIGYVLISARRLSILPIGRPAGALAGAVLMVAAGVLEPQTAWRHVDFNTLALLLGTMLISAHLAEAGFFATAADHVIRRAGTARGLLAGTVWGAGLLSALLVNDTVCVMVTPLLVAVLVRTRLPATPYLLALATGSNIGSALTLTGNPQNVIVGTSSGIPWLRFLVHMLPAGLIGLAINHALLSWWFGGRLPAGPLAAAEDAPPPADRPLMIKAAVAGALTVLGFCVLPTAALAWTAMGGAVVVIVLARRDPHEAFARVDWPLLVFFAALFVMVGGLAEAGWTERARVALDGLTGDDAAGTAAYSAFSLVGSNIFSNVPFVMVVGKWLGTGPEHELRWMLLALTSTLAGNLTLVGSVANIIVAETARRHHALGFFEYLAFGLPSTLLITAVAVAVLCGTHALLAGTGW